MLKDTLFKTFVFSLTSQFFFASLGHANSCEDDEFGIPSDIGISEEITYEFGDPVQWYDIDISKVTITTDQSQGPCTQPVTWYIEQLGYSSLPVG